MAEPDLITTDIEDEQAELDAEDLPDEVESEESGITLFQQLDEGNLVDKLRNLPGGTQQVAADTMRLLSKADESMEKWKRRYDEALKLAKLEAESEKKTFPFEDASTVMMPFILEAMLDFHSRTVPELVWAKDIVAMRTFGQSNEQKELRAERSASFMNYQLINSIICWRPDQDKLLLALPCVGTAYKKTYYNGDDKKVASDMLHADEVKFDHNYETFDEAPDYFVEEEYLRNEVVTFIRGEEEWDLDERALEKQTDHPDPFEFVRAYTWIDMDQDGLTEPYEVVIYKEKEQVVSVYPAYDEESIKTNDNGDIVDVQMVEIFTQYRFLPDPEGGPMGMGWGILLCDMFTSINTTMRQLIDAGTLANLAGNSGLIDSQMGGGAGRGNRQQSGPIEVRMGELTPVTTGGKPLGQSVVQFPYSGPNQTLFALLEYMVEQVRSMTNAALNMDTNNQEAAMMYLARLQQGLKVPNSIVMRVYECARREFKKIAELNFKHYDDEFYNEVLDPEEGVTYSMRKDFNPENCDIEPATDPSQGSDIERQQRAQMVLEEAKDEVGGRVLNVRQAYLDWLTAMKTPDIETLAPEPDPGPSQQEQMVMANMARLAELDERRMSLDEAKLELDRMETMLEASRKGAEFGLELDKTEAEIASQYAAAFHKLWEMGMAGDDPVATVQDIETRLIDKQVALPPPVPLDSPQPNAAQTGAPAE